MEPSQTGQDGNEPPVAPTPGHQANLCPALQGRSGPERRLPHREPLRRLQGLYEIGMAEGARVHLQVH